MLHNLTDAYAPYVDSSILMFSLIAQFLLMNRKLETWWFWLLVMYATLSSAVYFREAERYCYCLLRLLV
ncbi:nicotinamide mononucleotide transporter [Arsukibacterium sp.]|uniref:nicotinamide mononucleotide transporter n=1 Tax=Arsukibacterium sp. TaxID=1977258 RepID=UPI00262DC53D|nr:nicotinamide mononucleotide transporter [Arsukibacterium sp.]